MESSTIVMTEESTRIRNYLTDEGAEHFDDVYFKRKLGATPNVFAISHMYMDVARNPKYRDGTSGDMIDTVTDITRFFRKLRGDSSYAVVTAMEILTDGLEFFRDQPAAETAEYIIRLNEAYENEAAGWSKKIKNYGAQILKGKTSMLLYDYSSLAGGMIQVAAKNGQIMDLYVPESRFLNGGLPFVRDGVAAGHKIHFFPDAAIMYFMRKVDLAMMGAETFMPNGDMINTIGSELVGIACKRYEKPLYIPTTLIKVDHRAVLGIGRKELFRDLKDKMSEGWEADIREQVDFVCPNLDVVPPEHITAYITENGVIPPTALFGECRTYIRDLKRKIQEQARCMAQTHKEG